MRKYIAPTPVIVAWVGKDLRRREAPQVPARKNSGEIMRGYKNSGVVAAVAIMAVMVLPASITAQADGETWTFMVYMDADNNLEIYGDMNLDWLETVGSTTEVNILVLLDRWNADGVQLLHVEEGDSTPFGGEEWEAELNMADPATLGNFIIECWESYPADKYALVLWDHGAGWRGICEDDNTMDPENPIDDIDMVELREAFEMAYAVTKTKLDIVAFDACLMAMPEVAYQIRGFASYAVFSEETVGGAGFPYDKIAADLVGDSSMDAVGLCNVIVDRFDEYYGQIMAYGSYTMSAFDMEWMDEIVDAVDALGAALDARLVDYMNYYQKDMIFADRYYYPYNVDLQGFAENLLKDNLIKDDAITAAANMVVDAVVGGIVACENGWKSEISHGLAIYLPSTNDGMHGLKPEYADVPFTEEATNWYDFVVAYSSFYGRTWGY